MTRLNMFLDTSTSPLVVLDPAKLAALRKGRGPTGSRPGRLSSQTGKLTLQNHVWYSATLDYTPEAN